MSRPGRVISQLLQFTRFSISDFLATAGPTLLLIIAVCGAAYWLVDPTPPRHVTLATGQENGAYEEFGKKYAAALAKHGIKLTLTRSLGSQENLQHLQHGQGADIAFVQSGGATQDDGATTSDGQQLVALGSLFTEPVWIFFRDSLPIVRLADLKGLKVNLGPEGSGVPHLFRKLLDVNGMTMADMTVGALENTPATVELLEGRIDALVFSSAPDAVLIQMLLQTPGIKLFDFAQAEAYTRRLPFLSHVVLARGIVDLGRDLPPQDYHLIAPTATLVARADLHPALIDLLVQAAAEIHGGPGWFRKAGEFPSAHYTEIPVAPEAAKFYKNGAPFLQHYLPYWLANFIDRMWVFVIAFGAVILPLSKVVPPLYVWRIRSRVYRWYGQLRTVEQAAQAAPADRRQQVCEDQLRRLDEIEQHVNQISIPLSFADDLYGLRSHINFVRMRVQRLLDAGAQPDGGTATPLAQAAADA